MTSEKPSDRRLTLVDTWDNDSRPYFLREDDTCYFYGEYTPRAKYDRSATNDLISNFKKEMDRKGRPEWRYKEEAINKAGGIFAALLKSSWLRGATLVPMPPSKARHDPAYDDRLVRMLRVMERRVGYSLDIRELLYQTESTRSSSQSGIRVTVEELRAVYRIDSDLVDPWPERIGIFDDLLSAGRHFRVAKDLLQDRFPDADIQGFFIARTIQKPDDIGW